MYIVYSATGKEATHTYYGYGKIDEYQQNFLTNAKTYNLDRGDARLLDELGNDESKVCFEIIETVATEFEAWMLRNELRTHNKDSITPPSFFPTTHTRDMEQQNKEMLQTWQKHAKCLGKQTARQAWADGLWNNQEMKNLCVIFPKQMVLKDLDDLTPFEFNAKYFLIE